MKDNVNHPRWYTKHPSGVECIEITRHYCFSIGNAIKYLWRAGLKKEQGLEDTEKEIEDLNKAIWYIKDRIKQLTKVNMKRFYFKMTVNGTTIDVNCMAKTKQEAELLFVKAYQDIDKLEFIKFE